MNRPPRSKSDTVVTRQLIGSTFFILGPMHMLAAYLAFFSAMNDYGYPPWVLFGVNLFIIFFFKF